MVVEGPGFRIETLDNDLLNRQRAAIFGQKQQLAYVRIMTSPYGNQKWFDSSDAQAEALVRTMDDLGDEALSRIGDIVRRFPNQSPGLYSAILRQEIRLDNPFLDAVAGADSETYTDSLGRSDPNNVSGHKYSPTYEKAARAGGVRQAPPLSIRHGSSSDPTDPSGGGSTGSDLQQGGVPGPSSYQDGPVVPGPSATPGDPYDTEREIAKNDQNPMLRYVNQNYQRLGGVTQPSSGSSALQTTTPTSTDAVPVDKGFWQNDMWSPIKALTREFFGIASVPMELIQGTLRLAANTPMSFNPFDPLAYAESQARQSGVLLSLVYPALHSEDWFGEERPGVWDQTVYGNRFAQADVGDGWFIEGRVAELQARATWDAGNINGRVWSLGTAGLAAVGMDPTSTSYSFWSGAIDLVSSVLLDPVTYAPVVGPITKGLKAAGAAARAAETAARAAKAPAAAEAFASAAGKAEKASKWTEGMPGLTQSSLGAVPKLVGKGLGAAGRTKAAGKLDRLGEDIWNVGRGRRRLLTQTASGNLLRKRDEATIQRLEHLEQVLVPGTPEHEAIQEHASRVGLLAAMERRREELAGVDLDPNFGFTPADGSGVMTATEREYAKAYLEVLQLIDQLPGDVAGSNGLRLSLNSSRDHAYEEQILGALAKDASHADHLSQGSLPGRLEIAPEGVANVLNSVAQRYLSVDGVDPTEALRDLAGYADDGGLYTIGLPKGSDDLSHEFGIAYGQEALIDPGMPTFNKTGDPLVDKAIDLANGTTTAHVSQIGKVTAQLARQSNIPVAKGRGLDKLRATLAAAGHTADYSMSSVHANDVIEPEVLASIIETMGARAEGLTGVGRSLLEHAGISREKAEKAGPGVAQFLQDLLAKSDYSGRLTAILARPGLTYRELMEFTRNSGVNSGLRTALRASGIQAVRGLDETTGHGVFWTAASHAKAGAVSVTPHLGGQPESAVLRDLDFSRAGPRVLDKSGAWDRETLHGLAQYAALVEGHSQAVMDKFEHISAKESAKGAAAEEMLNNATLDEDLGAVIQDFEEAIKPSGDRISSAATAAADAIYEARVARIQAEAQTLRHGLARQFGMIPGFSMNPEAGYGRLDLATAKQVLGGFRLGSVFMKRALHKIIRTGNLRTLVEMTNGKWDADAYPVVAQIAKDFKAGKISEENALNAVIRIAAEQIGINSDAPFNTVRAIARSDEGSKLARITPPVYKFVDRVASNIPNGRVVRLNDKNSALAAIMDYSRFHKLSTFEGGKPLDALIRQLLEPDQGQNQAQVTRKVMGDLLNLIAKRTIGKLEKSKLLNLEQTTRIIERVEAETRYALGGLHEMNSFYAQRHGMDAFMDLGVDELSIVSPTYDTELLQSSLVLPNTVELDRVEHIVGRMIAKHNSIDTIVSAIGDLYVNKWRTIALVRAAFVGRNMLEINSRTFLAGSISPLRNPLHFASIVAGMRHYKSARWTALMEKVARNNLTVHGRSFIGSPTEEDLLDNAEVNEAMQILRSSNGSRFDDRIKRSAALQGFLPVAAHQAGFREGWANELVEIMRSRIHRAVMGFGLDRETWAKLDQVPLKTSPNKEVTGDLFYERQLKLLKIMARSDWETLLSRVGIESSKELQRLATQVQALRTSDPMMQKVFESEAAMRALFWEHPQSYYNRHVRATMNRDPGLDDFVRTGVLKDPDGKILTEYNYGEIQDSLKDLMKGLSSRYSNELKEARRIAQEPRAQGSPDLGLADLIGRSQFRVDRKSLPDYEGKDIFPAFDRAGDIFFSWAGEIERIGGLGPEFVVHYWNQVADMIPLMDLESVQALKPHAERTLSLLRRMTNKGPVPIGRSHPVWEAIKRREREAAERHKQGLPPDEGPGMNLDDAHGIATVRANRHVRDLFYDAQEKKQFSHVLRLVVSFANAWADTIYQWSKAILGHPDRAYEAMKAFKGATDPGSSVIYEYLAPLFGGDINASMPASDPNQGFLYANEYGDYQFGIPLMGSGMSAAVNFIAGTGSSHPFDMGPSTMSLGGLNTAFSGGSIMPGVGPLAQLGLGAVGLDRPQSSALMEFVRQTAFPMGSESPGQSFIPSWFSKIKEGIALRFGALSWLTDETVQARAMKPAMSWLMSTGSYDNVGNDPLVQQQLLEDARRLAGSILIMNGVGQFVLPTSPIVQYQALSDDGTMYGLSSLNAIFQENYANKFEDYNQAVGAFLEDYGQGPLMALLSASDMMSRVPTTEGWLWMKEHPNAMDAYSFYIPELFPGDEGDMEARRWLEQQGVRRVKSWKELTDDALGLIRMGERAQLLHRLTAGGATPDQVDLALATYEDSWFGNSKQFTDTRVVQSDELIQNVLPRMLNDPDFQGLPSIETARKAYRLRDWAVKEAAALGFKTLASDRLSRQRELYKRALQQLEDVDPSFVYLARHFRKEMGI